ncbi:hypothetical protein FoTM2_017665 [Fusarium oxysporum f. sp. vasinfectum]|nr:hypothetical protein FoTM2_017665 [Fusarium oxysporum f. sp. vasinfectum]
MQQASRPFCYPHVITLSVCSTLSKPLLATLLPSQNAYLGQDVGSIIRATSTTCLVILLLGVGK